MYNYHNKKKFIWSIFLILLLAIGIGYAYLTSNLSISGNTQVTTNTWNIHFENLSITTGSVTTSSPATINGAGDAITYTINLNRPKEYYEFTVDVKNDGSLPGKVSISELSGITTEAGTIIDYSVAYTNGNPVNIGDILNAGSKRKIKVRVFYKDEINPSDFPATDLNLNLTYTLQYIQSDVDGTTSGTLLQKMLENNSCITKYDGQVTDSVNLTKQATSVYINKCQDKRNIIFGGYCWQVIRTTENGGLKMIYNGEPINGNCSSSRSKKTGISSAPGNTLDITGGPYVFGKSFNYNPLTTRFTLLETTTTTWSDSTYESLLGQYSCLSNSDTCTTLYAINSYDTNDSAYVTTMSTSNISYSLIGKISFNSNCKNYAMAGYMFNKTYENKMGSRNLEENFGGNTYEYGSSYHDNGDGTYTIESPTAFTSWSSSIRYNVENKYLCKNPVNSTCNDLWYVYDTYSSFFRYYIISENYKFSDSFVYNNGTYSLSGDVEMIWNNVLDENKLKTHHYTCFNAEGVCNELAYISSFSSDRTLWYINIKDGKGIEDVLDETIRGEDLNKHDSTIKSFVDIWYSQNFTQYTSKLEDAVYCNSRDIVELNGWDPNNNSLSRQVVFKNDELSSSLDCNDVINQFSVSNNKAKLKYPVGLITAEELNLLGSNSLRATPGELYWTMTPAYYDGTDLVIYWINSNGEMTKNNGGSRGYGVRPVITLAANNDITSGTGSETDPWIVE